MSRPATIRRDPRRTTGLSLLTLAPALLTLAAAPAVRAEGDAARGKTAAPARNCQTTYQRGQVKEKAGQLVEASRLYASCSDLSCGAATWRACVAASTHLHASLPSVIPVVLDDDGEPRADVEVRMDGQVIASQLTGLSIAVDPGPHDFSFSIDSGVFASTKIDVVEGERNRPLSMSYVAARDNKHPAAQHHSATAQK